MSFGERYFGLETEHGATTQAAAAFLKAAVLAVAVALSENTVLLTRLRYSISVKWRLWVGVFNLY